MLGELQAAIASAKPDGAAWDATLTIPTQATRKAAGKYLLSVRQGETSLISNRPVQIAADNGSVVLENVVLPSLGKNIGGRRDV